MKRRTYLLIVIGVLLLWSAVGMAGCQTCLDQRTGKPIDWSYCERYEQQLRAYMGEASMYSPTPPTMGFPPMYAPGMTSQQFVGPGGGPGVFCNTTNDGYGGSLTICN